MFDTQTSPKTADKATPSHVTVAYLCFLVCAGTVYHFVANGHFSSILTMSVMFQCLALSLLGIHVVSKGSVAGVSARALALEGLSFACRLSSTTWLNGYLPVDASGDWIYQAVDMCSLLIVAFLLYHVLVTERSSYNEDADSLPIVPMAVGSLVLAIIFHANMNSRPIFDTLWMVGLFVGVVAVLPQLWLISRSSGVVHACEGHYIAMMAISRVLSGSFMWHARFDITCERWIHGANQAVLAILAAHALHLILLGDFAYFYIKSITSKGLGADIDLRMDLDMV